MRLVFVLSMFFALLPNTGQTPQRPQRVSLEVGSVNVWLGMTKEEATKRFSDAGYQVTLAGDQLLMRRGSDAQILWFKDGRLAFANQVWNTTDKTDDVDAILGALGSLAEKVGNQPCSVSHAPISSPDSSSNRVFISCGERSVLISKGTMLGKPFVDISERIGDIPTKPE